MTSLDLGKLEPVVREGYGLLEAPRADRQGGADRRDLFITTADNTQNPARKGTDPFLARAR